MFGVATCLVRRRASLAVEAAERAAAEAAEIMREPETNAFIVDRIKAALDVNKACATEEQRREYLIGLAYTWRRHASQWATRSPTIASSARARRTPPPNSSATAGPAGSSRTST